MLLGVGGSVYIPHTLDPFKRLGLNSHKANKLGFKLHEHSVQYAYKLVSTQRALEKSIDNSRHNNLDGGSARHAPDTH